MKLQTVYIEVPVSESPLMIGQKCPECSNGFMRMESWNALGVDYYYLICDGLIYSSNERELPVACEHTISLPLTNLIK